MSVLVIAEHNNSSIKPATLNTVSAACQFNTEITLLVAGYRCQSVAELAARISGVNKIMVADAPAYEHHLAENLAALVVEFGGQFSHIMTPATTFGKNFMPRVAALLDVAQISEITEILASDTFTRPVYAGNAMATVQAKDAIKVMTVRCTAFPLAAYGVMAAPIESLNIIKDLNISRFVSQELNASERPELTAARIIVAGGRGMQSGDKFHLLEKIATKLGAAIGASRAAVDAGFVPNDYQVGQTGKVVAPDLYIAFGISGAIQHLAGMKDSKVIVAINKDADAPIFQVADYGLVGDLFEILPQLEAELEKVLGK